MAWVAQFELSNQREYQSWLLRTTNQLWLNFEKEFIALWNENLSAEEKAFHGDSLSSYQHAYMQKLFQQTVGFAGLEICRRTVGIAGVTDIRGLEDSAARARAESACLKIGKSLVESCFNLSNSNKLTQQVSEWRLQAYAADKKSTTTKSTTLIGAIGCASVVGLFFAARAGRQTSSMKNAVRYLAKR
jgi:5-methylthioribose kinase